MTSLTLPTEVAERADATTGRVVELCTHCQTAVPAGLVQHGADQQFCCEGCRTVYQMIRGCGLDAYYALRESTGECPKPVAFNGKRFEEFDDPAFHALYCTSINGAQHLKCVRFYLQNVHCGACVWLVEKLPHVAPAVKEARLDFGKRIVHLTWDTRRAELSDIARKLASLGYPPHPASGQAQRQLRQAEDREHLVRIAISGAVAGNMMIISFALYGGMFDVMEPIYERLFHWTSLLLMMVSVCGPGLVFFRGAISAWRTKTMHMDVPVAMGLAAGSIWSALNAVRASPEIYFDSLSVLVFLLLVGRWIQLRQQRRSQDAIELLFSVTPSTARLVEDNTVREVPVRALRVGQTVEVRAGDSVPVDGVIARGSSLIDASLLTGESKPVRANEGDRIHAGAVNLSSVLRITTESIGEATRVGRLMRLVEDSSRRRAPIVRLADRIAGAFVVVVLSLALATFGAWLWIDSSEAMKNTMALLIITCPCALGLATPLAIIAGIGRAAQHGMLIRGGDVVERLNRPGLVLLDKTGTITQGAMIVTDWHGPERLKPIVAAIEAHSSHPLALALATAWNVNADIQPEHVQECTGRGIESIVAGQRIVIGSRAYVKDKCVAIPDWTDALETQWARRAITPILIGVDGVVQAIAGVGDPVKPDAARAVQLLRCAGWNVGILSGDHQEVVAAVARQIGIDPANCRGRATPEEKLALVQSALGTQPVMMVGDGVNDAAALAAATVGVAVKGGAEAAFTAADVYLNRAGLMPLVELVHGARRTFSIIRRNIIISLMYNVAGVTLAVSGVINPLIAAILMPISSLTVIVLSYRSRTFERDESCQ